MKRVVSSFLLQIDQLPSYVVVIGASNHPELLDRAVWRRFQVRLELPSPTRAQLEWLFARFEAQLGKKLGLTRERSAEKFRGSNFAEAGGILCGHPAPLCSVFGARKSARNRAKSYRPVASTTDAAAGAVQRLR